MLQPSLPSSVLQPTSGRGGGGRRNPPRIPPLLTFFTSLSQQAINLYVISLIVEVDVGLEPYVTFAFVSLTLSLSQ